MNAQGTAIRSSGYGTWLNSAVLAWISTVCFQNVLLKLECRKKKKKLVTCEFLGGVGLEYGPHVPMHPQIGNTPLMDNYLKVHSAQME